MNIMMTLLTQLNNKDHDRHHVFDTISGTLLMMERLTLAFLFFVGIVITYTQSRYRIKQYLKSFSVLGGLYICSMPLVVVFANYYIQPASRNEFVFIVVESLKSLCNILLTYMVSSSKSEYSKLCYRNASFLPEGTNMF